MSYYKDKNYKKKAKTVAKDKEVVVVEHDIIDKCILGLKGDENNVAIVKLEYAVLTMLPMIYLCNWND